MIYHTGKFAKKIQHKHYIWGDCEQCIPKEGCSETQVDAEFAAASVSTKVTIRPDEPPVCRSATTTSSVSMPFASLLAHHKHDVYCYAVRCFPEQWRLYQCQVQNGREPLQFKMTSSIQKSERKSAARFPVCWWLRPHSIHVPNPRCQHG